MAKSRAWKKVNSKPVQPHLPGIPPPLLPGTTRVLRMDLRVGDRLGDETGEWEVINLADLTHRPPASSLAFTCGRSASRRSRRSGAGGGRRDRVEKTDRVMASLLAGRKRGQWRVRDGRRCELRGKI